MRVLHFGKYWQQHGGIETYVKTLCKSLATEGVDVVNLVSSLDATGSELMVDGYRVVEAPTWGIHFSTSVAPGMLSAARQLHKATPFDLIHLHFPDPMSHLASLALPAHIPRVIGWHSDIIKQKRLLQLYRPFQLRAINQSQAIVAATDAHLASSKQIPISYPSEKRWVIPYGIELDRFNQTPEIAQKIKALQATFQGRYTVFAVGRHVDYKGFRFLIEAIQHTSAILVLGGNGPLTADLKQLTHTLGLTDRVTFTGPLTETDLVAQYHACNVFCLPSISQNEAFGIVQVEAMACSKPVINTQLKNGVNEVSPHLQTGLTVKPKDPVALGQAIETLKNEPLLRKQLGQQARQRAQSRFSTSQLAHQHVQLYRALLHA